METLIILLPQDRSEEQPGEEEVKEARSAKHPSSLKSSRRMNQIHPSSTRPRGGTCWAVHPDPHESGHDCGTACGEKKETCSGWTHPWSPHETETRAHVPTPCAWSLSAAAALLRGKCENPEAHWPLA